MTPEVNGGTIDKICIFFSPSYDKHVKEGHD